MNKKADVNWVIVGMIIAIIVLFVVAYIFYTQTKTAKTNIEGLSACESRGGICMTKAECDNDNTKECFWRYGGCPKEKGSTLEYCGIPIEK